MYTASYIIFTNDVFPNQHQAITLINDYLSFMRILSNIFLMADN